jgi:hypothetical protein
MMFAVTQYLPSLRLNFPGGASNEYRLRGHEVDFRGNAGSWRILGEDEVQLHFVLHTEVAKWLMKVSGNAKRTGSIT